MGKQSSATVLFNERTYWQKTKNNNGEICQHTTKMSQVQQICIRGENGNFSRN